MKLISKLSLLADAAKYDASCASSGTTRRDSSKGKGLGSSGGMGICHSYAPDGRCISLLKILLTNFCVYDCSYCINRSSSGVARARFSVDEIVYLTLEFYKRNYIEGLFLSSGIIQSSDYTMEQLVQVAKTLRVTHDFRGYIHLKTIPEASPELLAQAGRYADRLSINIELPSDESLARFAPEKNAPGILRAMGQLKDHIDEATEFRKKKNANKKKSRKKHKEAEYSPAGQSTQMIVGADQSDDGKILLRAKHLYQRYRMRRVYYSAFSPIPDASSKLPPQAPPLQREHRLYQADWLLRFYGFSVDEITGAKNDLKPVGPHVENTESKSQMLDLDIDPKLAWALRNREWFPVDVNRAPMETLLRVPGIGSRGAQRIVQSRKFRALRFSDLSKCGLSLKKISPFVQTRDHRPTSSVLEGANLRDRFVESKHAQLSLF